MAPTRVRDAKLSVILQLVVLPNLSKFGKVWIWDILGIASPKKQTPQETAAKKHFSGGGPLPNLAEVGRRNIPRVSPMLANIGYEIPELWPRYISPTPIIVWYFILFWGGTFPQNGPK